MTDTCPQCRGCGQVANTEDREPWSDWLALPLQSAAAVVMGLVRPLQCPRCRGTGCVDLVPIDKKETPSHEHDDRQ